MKTKPGAARVLVISDALWRRCFNADPAVIGRAINFNGASWTVVGVLPADFDFYGRTNGNNDTVPADDRNVWRRKLHP